MTQPEVLILDTYSYDNKVLEKYLIEGYYIKHVIPYIESTFNCETLYDSRGGCHTQHQKSGETNKFKYILERDGISRLLRG